MRSLIFIPISLILIFSIFTSSCLENKKPNPRLTLFIGIDISGSYKKSEHYVNSLDFISHYIYAHLNGLGDLETPANLFVGTIGGSKSNEPKTFFPIQAFQDKSVEQIRAKIDEIFSLEKENRYTDFNAFFKHIAATVEDRKLILRPISVVLLTDGDPDFANTGKNQKYKKIDLSPLENLSRDVTIRLLYTDANTSAGWKDSVRRKRIKVWTQDAIVMKDWRESNVFLPGTPIEQQTKFFKWINNNVDFGVRLKRVD